MPIGTRALARNRLLHALLTCTPLYAWLCAHLDEATLYLLRLAFARLPRDRVTADPVPYVLHLHALPRVLAHASGTPALFEWHVRAQWPGAVGPPPRPVAYFTRKLADCLVAWPQPHGRANLRLAWYIWNRYLVWMDFAPLGLYLLDDWMERAQLHGDREVMRVTGRMCRHIATSTTFDVAREFDQVGGRLSVWLMALHANLLVPD